MKIILFSAKRFGSQAQSVPTVLAALALSGSLLLSGCGRSDQEPTSSTSESPTPSAIVEAPQNETTSASTIETSTSPQAVVAEATPPKTLYVVTPFEAVSELGTHQFPVGAKVNLVEEDGDDYLVEYQGVAVRNGRKFFSETWAEGPVPPVIDASPVSSPASNLGGATPDPRLSAEEHKSAELLGEIRSINEEIRRAQDTQKMEATPDDEIKDSSEIKQLKRRRDALSEDLTDFAKP